MKCLNCNKHNWIEFTRLEEVALNTLPILQEQLADFKEEVKTLREENTQLRCEIAALERKV